MLHTDMILMYICTLPPESELHGSTEPEHAASRHPIIFFSFFLAGRKGANTLTFHTRNNAAGCSTCILEYQLPLHTNILVLIKKEILRNGHTYQETFTRNAACPFWSSNKNLRVLGVLVKRTQSYSFHVHMYTCISICTST